MLRRRMFPLLPALAIAAIAVTGCGGSSKKSSASTTSTAAGSNGGSATSGTTTSSGGGSASSLSTSTPLNSPLAQRLFAQEGVTHGLTQSQASKFVACLEQKFASQGLKTFGDASTHGSQTRQDSESCAAGVK